MATRTEQHTPGPWAVGPYGSDLEIQGGGIQLARVRTTRAGVDELAEPRAVPIPEAGANARLIAAAPDLLAALLAMIAYREEWEASDQDGHHFMCDMLDVEEAACTCGLDAARAAIAKATATPTQERDDGND